MACQSDAANRDRLGHGLARAVRPRTRSPQAFERSVEIAARPALHESHRIVRRRVVAQHDLVRGIVEAIHAFETLDGVAAVVPVEDDDVDLGLIRGCDVDLVWHGGYHNRLTRAYDFDTAATKLASFVIDRSVDVCRAGEADVAAAMAGDRRFCRRSSA